MAQHGYNTMIHPAIEELIERTESKFVLVSLAAKRSREITDYWGDLGETGIGAAIPPQIMSASSKSLSIALEEIAEGKIEAIPIEEPEIDDTVDADDNAGDAGEATDDDSDDDAAEDAA